MKYYEIKKIIMLFLIDFGQFKIEPNQYFFCGVVRVDKVIGIIIFRFESVHFEILKK